MPRRWTCGLAIAAALLATGCSAFRVSKREEVRLGRQTAAAVERQYRTYSDPAVSQIGQRLAAVSRRPDLPWSFEVIDAPDVNAISLPGGPVYIYEGLLRRIAGDEDMLAAVLAHEVGHVEERHVAEQIERQQLYGLGLAVLRRAGDGDAAAIGEVAASLKLLSFGRRQEYQADDRAIELMRKAGYDPQGLVRLLELLRRQGGDPKTFHWLRTHPTTQARIDRARERIAGT